MNIEFKIQEFTYKATRYDNKKNVLFANKFDQNNNLIKKVELRFGELPKKVKQQLNPLKSNYSL